MNTHWVTRLAGGASALALATAIALTPGTAAADVTKRILDAPLVSPTYSRIETWNSTATTAGGPTGSPNNNFWGDELGGGNPFDGFRSGAIDVTWYDNGNVGFTLYTNFGLSGATVGGLFVGFADLFISIGDHGTQANPSWEYAVDFKSESLNQSPDTGGANLARLVANPTFQTSQQIVRGNLQYGGLTNICSGSTDAACQTGSRAPETKVTNGSGVYDLAVTDLTGAGSTTLTGPNGSQTYGAAYNVILAGVNADGSWDSLRVFWGTGWCANDTIEGTAVVPIPAALPMLLAAVGGLGLAGWRQRRKAA
jgi:hypothetical protein